MKLAVIGATGFIGTEFIKYACSQGHSVIGFDQSEACSPQLDQLEGFRFCHVSPTEPSVELDGVDGLVLLAARRPSAEFGFEDYLGNIRIAHSYFELALDQGVRNIVFASSKAVYSGDDAPWSETMASTPLSLYGASKLAAEQLALIFNRDRGAAIKCLRFAQVIGMGERKGYLINTLIDNARAGRQQVVYGTGAQRRQYIYIRDVCSAMLTALEHPETGGIFNIGMPGSISNLEMALCVNHVFGNEGNLTHDYARQMGDNNDEMTVLKAQSVLDWTAAYDLERTFRDIAGQYID